MICNNAPKQNTGAEQGISIQVNGLIQKKIKKNSLSLNCGMLSDLTCVISYEFQGLGTRFKSTMTLKLQCSYQKRRKKYFS